MKKGGGARARVMHLRSVAPCEFKFGKAVSSEIGRALHDVEQPSFQFGVPCVARGTLHDHPLTFHLHIAAMATARKNIVLTRMAIGSGITTSYCNTEKPAKGPEGAIGYSSAPSIM
jgi:hypothetical protein